MPTKFKPIDLKNVKTYPLSDRKGKVSSADFAGAWVKGGYFKEFLERLPKILSGSDIKAVIAGLTKAARQNKTVIFGMGAHVIKVGLNPIIIDLMQRGIISGVAMNGAGIIHDLEVAMAGQTSEDVAASIDDGSFGMGAHVIKVGLNPIIIDLMQRGIITGVAMNGAGIIHDLEVAMAGQTSEDVAASIDDGSFGMAGETADFLNQAITESDKGSFGLGQSVGRAIMNNQLPQMEHSILAAGWRLDIPVTVHVAIGTDIIHMHPQFDPAKAGQASHRDFRILTAMVGALEGGVYLNVGSAVVLPEVFLKAVTLARNLGHTLDHFMTINIDFIRHYRPMTNVIQRPTARGGTGINLVGHHEILVPLIAAGIIEELD